MTQEQVPGQQYRPRAVSGYYPSDIHNFGAPNQGSIRGATNPRFEAQVVHQGRDVTLVQWRLFVDDLGGGLNMQEGPFSETYDRISDGDGDARFYRQLLNPQMTTAQSTLDPSGTRVGIHTAHFNDVMHVACGAGANVALLRETTATNPTLIATHTYTPNSPITCIGVAVAGGATNAERLFVGLRARTSNDVVQLFSPDYGTATSMHDDTAACWGIVQTYENGNALMIYSGGASGAAAIRLLDSTAAVNTQPDTNGLTNVPNGGFIAGIAKLAQAPHRVIMCWPFQDTPNGALLSSAEKPMRVVSVNFNANEYYELPVGMPFVYSCWLTADKAAVISSNKERVTYYDGRGPARDLFWIENRTPDSDYIYEFRGGFCNGPEIWVRVNKRKSASGAANATQVFWEVYNLETGAVHRVSAAATLASTGSYGNLPGGELPFSKTTGFAHVHEDADWRRIFVPVYGYSPLNLYRKTSGAAAGTGNQYEETSTTETTAWDLPGLEGGVHRPTRIYCGGDIDAGGAAADATSPAKVEVWVANAEGEFTNGPATFVTGKGKRWQIGELNDRDFCHRIKLRIKNTRQIGGTDPTRYTPNPLPLVVEGFTEIPTLMLPAVIGLDKNR